MPTSRHAALPGTVFLLSLSLSLSAVTPAKAAESDTKQSQTEDTSTELDEVTITGRAQSLYRIDDGSLATKTDTPIERTPQSLQILPQTLIEDQAATEVTDLYRSISGVSQYNYANITFRGFRQNDVRYDGVRGDPYGNISTPKLFNIQQVQVLKGPSGALYGAGSPGGMINYVTKKPTYERDNSVKVTAGNGSFLSGSVEMSGPVSGIEDQRYRVGYYQDHEEPFRNNADKRNRMLDLGYAFDLSATTSLTLQFTDVMQRNQGERFRGIPADEDGNFLTSMEYNFNEKSDFLNLDASIYQATLEHLFASGVSMNLVARYFDDTERQKYHEPKSADDTDSDGVADYAEREYRDQDRSTQAGSLTANFVIELDEHTLLLGGDYSNQNEAYVYNRARTADGVVGISYDNPQYGVTDPDSYTMHLISDADTRSIRYGVYAQDQWRVTPDWDLVASASVNAFKDQAREHSDSTEEKFDDTGYAYRLGSTYRINDNLHPYISWATGLTPQDVSDQLASSGGPFDPEKLRQTEIGLRTFWLDNAINANLAVYHIVREDILQEDPDNTDLLVALGKVRSRGFEVDVLGDITDNWVINANYAHNDTVVEEASDGISRSVGKRFANAPLNQFGLWTRYDLASLNSAVAFGADYVSEQFDQNGGRVKPYTVFDMSWQTAWNDWDLQLNIKNLLDREYAVSGFLTRTGQFPGEPRRIYLSAAYQF